MRTGHVLGDHTTNTAEQLASAVDTGRGGADVGLDDAPSRPRAGDAGEIDAELLRDPANDGVACTRALAAATRSLQQTVVWCTRTCAEAVEASDGPLLGVSSPGSPMSTSSVPTGAISPSGTRILSTVPAYGEGNLDGRLVRLDLDERIVLGDLLPLGDGQRATSPSVSPSPRSGSLNELATAAILPRSPEPPPVAARREHRKRRQRDGSGGAHAAAET